MGVADGPGAHVPALQVIILGSGGGPIEHNTTAFLVRSLAAGWGKGSLVAVDAGVHLGAISRILEQTQPAGLGTKHALPYMLNEGAFAGLEIASASAATNAAHITRNLVDTYLITHPHLDHISGLVINTAGLPGTRAKRIAGLPSTIAAIKTHIFNNVIWPNLSDENNGAGLLTYMRLVEGGSPAMGEGEGRGYLEVSDGLAVKVYGVSHGHCIERHSHRGSSSGPSGVAAAAAAGGPALGSPRHSMHSHSPATMPGGTVERVGSGGIHTPTTMSRVPSLLAANNAGGGSQDFYRESVCVYDSSAYFLRDVNTGREVLIFGDVEPDSISLSPRNLAIWQEAAPKIAAGQLAAVLIECSYDDAQSVDRLYGHLKPCYVAEEMRALAAEVQLARQEAMLAGEARRTKRKRDGGEDGSLQNGNGLVLGESRKRATSRRPRGSGITDDELSPRTTRPLRPSSIVHGEDALQMPHFPQGYGPGPGAAGITDSPSIAGPTAELSLGEVESLPDAVIAPPAAADADGAMTVSEGDANAAQPLRGLKVVVIHVKERLTDGPEVKDTILEQLLEYEAEDGLGCEYVISSVGQSLYL